MSPGRATESVFGSVYAAAYDTLYQGKDYGAECDLVERVFREYGSQPIKTVLDLGCGTGNHAIPLAQRGYTVTGVDRSAEMLEAARAKATGVTGLRFVEGDVRTVALGEQFDAALLMFAVLGYMVENGDVLSALRTARAHLRDGGLLFFDVWYGPAVLAERPSQRVAVAPTEDGGEVIRSATGALDTRRQLCTVTYDLWRTQGDRVLARTHEAHAMRYFFPRELELYLDLAGFRLLRLGVFEDGSAGSPGAMSREPDDTTWNVGVVAQAGMLDRA